MIHYKTVKGILKAPEAKQIRKEVFIDEQGFQNEFDTIDQDAFHLIVYDDNTPIATARTFPKNDDNSVYIIGRVAVKKSYRGQHLGSYMLKILESFIRNCGGRVLELSAQTRVKNFYEKDGYLPFGSEYLDEYCPHISMRKIL